MSRTSELFPTPPGRCAHFRTTWTSQLEHVDSVDVAAERLKAMQIGLCNLLQIGLTDGHDEKFIVRDLDEVVVELQRQIDGTQLRRSSAFVAPRTQWSSFPSRPL